jgi:serine/threonine-protein kinase RsbW
MPPCDVDPTAGPRAPRPVSGAPASLAFVLPAELAAPWLARNRLRTWLVEELAWPAELVDDVEYAVSEAVSNVAEHAYAHDVHRGTVEVHALVEEIHGGPRRLRISISDAGRWQPVDPDPALRGRGLFMMNSLMDEVMIQRGEGPGARGTEVVLLSPPAPSPSR